MIAVAGWESWGSEEGVDRGLWRMASTASPEPPTPNHAFWLFGVERKRANCLTKRSIYHDEREISRTKNKISPTNLIFSPTKNIISPTNFIFGVRRIIETGGRHSGEIELTLEPLSGLSVSPCSVSATDSAIRCAWPDEFAAEEFRGTWCTVAVSRQAASAASPAYIRREIKAQIVQP